MAIQTIESGSQFWDKPVNNNFHELDERTTANGGYNTDPR